MVNNLLNTPFHFLINYSAIKVLLIGIAATLSFLGTGLFIYDKLFGKQLPSYFALPLSLIIGLHLYSLVLQVIGFSQIITPVLLKYLLFTQLALGILLLINKINFSITTVKDLKLRVAKLSSKFSSTTGRLVLLILVISLLVNLVIALAPSTKADEIYKYMHVPLRMIQDGGIIYERINNIAVPMYIPSFHYIITAAPFYAVGFTDALNVVSWCLSFLFIYFIVGVVYQKTNKLSYAVLIALGFYTGMHSPVWYVTGGPGSISVLAMTMLVYIMFEGPELIGRFGSLRMLALVSLLSMATAATKQTYLPMALLCLLFFSVLTWKEHKYQNTLKILAVSSSFWIIFYLPAFIWSWLKSGYLFGPFSDPANAEISKNLILYSRTFEGLVYESSIALADLTPFIWGGCILFFLIPWQRKDKHAFWLATILFSAQIIFFIWKLPLHFRYFGGLHFGLALFFWANELEYVQESFTFILKSMNNNLLRLAVATIILPWLAMQLFYSMQFFPVVLGLQPAMAFSERLVPFYSDFKKLDIILPEDAILFVNTGYMPVYAPRRIIHKFEEMEMLKSKGSIYYFGSSRPAADEWPGSDLQLVYENDSAVIHAYRTPGQSPTLGHLLVYQLNQVVNEE